MIPDFLKEYFKRKGGAKDKLYTVKIGQKLYPIPHQRYMEFQTQKKVQGEKGGSGDPFKFYRPHKGSY